LSFFRSAANRGSLCKFFSRANLHRSEEERRVSLFFFNS
jgi:hypothetical protein